MTTAAKPLVADMSAFEYQKACQSSLGCDRDAQFLVWTAHTDLTCPWEGYLCQSHLDRWLKRVASNLSHRPTCKCGQGYWGNVQDNVKVLPL